MRTIVVKSATKPELRQPCYKIVASDKTRFFMRFWLVLVNQGVYDCLGGVAQVQDCHRCAARARGRVSIVASYVQHCKSQYYVTYGLYSAATVLAHTS